MVTWKSVEMIEHSADNTPNATAHAALPNGALVGLTYTNSSKVTKAPATSEELYVVMNTQTGDKEYATSYTIAQGEPVNLFKLSAWEGKELYVTEDNVTGTYANIAAGDTLTFDATTFKFKEDTPTAGDVCFKVLSKGGLNVNYLIVRIEIAAS